MLTTEEQPNLAFQGILHSVFHRPESSEGVVIAFTSACSGEGVSYVSQKVAAQVSSSCSESTIYLSSSQLSAATWPHSSSRFDSFKKNEEGTLKTAWDDWRSKVKTLRSRYRYSIIDCPSLSSNGDVLSLAPHLDGIVLVVAANETHKAQIANAERQIQMVNGKIIGFLLNKRKYMVPDWLYKRL